MDRRRARSGAGDAKENVRPSEQQRQPRGGGAGHLGTLLLAGATCLSVGLLHRVLRKEGEQGARSGPCPQCPGARSGAPPDCAAHAEPTLSSRPAAARPRPRACAEELQRARSDLESKSSQVEELTAELEGTRWVPHASAAARAAPALLALRR